MECPQVGAGRTGSASGARVEPGGSLRLRDRQAAAEGQRRRGPLQGRHRLSRAAHPSGRGPRHQPHRALLLRSAAALLPHYRRRPRHAPAVERYLAPDARLCRSLHRRKRPMSVNAPRSIDEYLKQLRRALEGQDPALIQDALYDAEEYLRAEVAAHPGKSEADVLELIASTYGAPEEVAAAYRDTEAKVKAALQTPAPRATGEGSGLARFFAVYQDPRSYTSLFYMLLTLATGVVYFTFVVTGVSLSAGFAFLIIGIPFFLAFIGIARVIALGEGRLLEAMTGERMPRRPLHALAGHRLEQSPFAERDHARDADEREEERDADDEECEAGRQRHAGDDEGEVDDAGCERQQHVEERGVGARVLIDGEKAREA